MTRDSAAGAALPARRAVLKGAPVALAALAATSCHPVALAAETDSEIMRLFREWQVLRANEVAAHTANSSEDGRDLASQRTTDLEGRLLAEPSGSAIDLVAKIAVWTDFGTFPLNEDTHPEFWDEARALVERRLA